MVEEILNQVITYLILFFSFIFAIFIIAIIGFILLIIGLKLKRKKYVIFGIILMVPFSLICLQQEIDNRNREIKERQYLRYYVTEGSSKELEEYLINNPNQLYCSYKNSNNIAEECDLTWFDYLCKNSSIEKEIVLEKIQIFINQGFDINRRICQYELSKEEHTYLYNKKEDFCGATPLMIACYNNDYELVKLLIENGADINIKDFNGNSTISYIINWKIETNEDLNERKDLINYLLNNGVTKEDYLDFQKIVKEKGLNFNIEP